MEEKRRIDFVSTAFLFHERKLLMIHHRKLNLWLPVGGHIETNETPDDAVLREIKEEVGISAEIFAVPSIVSELPTKKVLATPFYVDLHSVGDHDHVGFCYVCTTDNPTIEMNERELKNFRWIGKDELENIDTPKNTQHAARIAFGMIERSVAIA